MHISAEYASKKYLSSKTSKVTGGVITRLKQIHKFIIRIRLSMKKLGRILFLSGVVGAICIIVGGYFELEMIAAIGYPLFLCLFPALAILGGES